MDRLAKEKECIYTDVSSDAVRTGVTGAVDVQRKTWFGLLVHDSQQDQARRSIAPERLRDPLFQSVRHGTGLD